MEFTLQRVHDLRSNRVEGLGLRALFGIGSRGLLGWAGGLLSTWKTCCVYVGVPSWVNKLGMSDMEQVVSSASAAKNVSCLVNT